ncbi:MAG: winged helix-turn-helix transcriptional regulator [Candidatus Thorarchaeota archaeon]|nr:winged helix-turn-helix transcriptional regulator [Candidatus Thorarchaeota archaeon]
MDHGLTPNHLRILVALQQCPLGTYEELSERVGLAKSVVHGYVQELACWPQTNVAYYSVVANPNLVNLGLELVDVLVEADSEAKLQGVEAVCQKHPYTVYRARCFGDINGVLVQFRAPMGTSIKISMLFERAAREGICNGHRVLPFNKASVCYTTMNLDNWNHETGSWEFDWAEWFSAKGTFRTEKEQPQPVAADKEWLMRPDMLVIRELTRNARQKNKDIMDTLARAGFQTTSQAFSRRLERIKERCISGYRVQINPYAFDSYNPVLIWGEGEENEIRDLSHRVTQRPIPFTSTFKSFQDKVFWYVHLPATHLSDLLFYLRPILHDLRFHHIDYTRSRTYYLWPETFDDSAHEWKTDDSFMIDGVLSDM